MIEPTRTHRHRADPTKSSGIVYTPPALARFLASQAFDSLGDVASVRILDPACGDGELLLAAFEIAGQRGIDDTELVGYDVDRLAVETASERLKDSAPSELSCADFLEVAYRYCNRADIFQADRAIETPEFDLVISNPPYVRTQILGANTAQSLGRRFGLTGRIDLYHAFAIAMIQSLVPSGALGLLCSNKFLTNRAGRSMRRFLLNELEIDELVDLGDTKLFNAAVLPVIVSGRRRQNRQSDGARRFRSVYEVPRHRVGVSQDVASVLTALTNGQNGTIDDGERTFSIRDGLLDQRVDEVRPWNPIDASTLGHFEVIRRTAIADLSDIGKIRVGVKTTADAVFIRSDWSELPDSIRPEADLLRPLITHHDIHSWSCRPGKDLVLYPHCEDNGRTVAVNLEYYPLASNYLELNRDRLASRTYVKRSGRQWFEIWVPQRPSLWSRQKIVFPDISESPRFAVDNSGAVVNGDCYWMIVDDDDLADVITAVGNSSFCTWFYDAACGNFLYSGRRRFMTQYMERLPIPDPTPELVQRIREYRSAEDFTAIDALIWSALGFEQPLR